MNGHCDFHTFERAVDVCDLCYGDLCRSCALPVKGRKDRVCKDCALTVSGVRGNGKPEVRGDRRTVKERRKTYAAADEPEDFFQFFDTDLPPDALTTQLPPPPASKSDREKAAAEQSDAASDGLGIRRLFGRLKPGQPDSADVDSVAVGAILGDDGSAADGNESPAGKDVDAVSQLADIRRQDPTLSPNAAPAIGSSDRTNDIGAASVADSLDARPMHVPADQPPDSPVAIPSPLLQGFPDSAEETPNEIPSGLEQLSELTPLADVVVDPSAGPPDRAARGLANPSEVDHRLDDPLSADDDAAEQAAGETPLAGAEASSSFQGERRRTPPPVDEDRSDTGADELNASASASRSVDQMDRIPEASPRLRDLVADLSNDDPISGTADNPFLKRSRVVSEPNAVPDFSTDPFSEQQPAGSAPDADQGAERPRVPAPVSPKATPQPAPITPPTPEPQPAQPAANTPPTPEPQPAPPAANTPPTPEPQPAQPAAVATPTSAQEPPVGYSRADRHPLAAFAERDRHPLSAYAASASSTPTASQLPPIDDVFPDEPEELEAERKPDRRRAYEEIPPIDDLLPPDEAEPLESLEPAELIEPPRSLEPTDPPEPLESIEPTEPLTSLDPLEPTEPLEPSFEPAQSLEPLEPEERIGPPEFLEPLEPFTSFEPLESLESTEPLEPAPPFASFGPLESPDSTEPLEPLESLEPPEPLAPPNQPERPEPLEEPDQWGYPGQSEPVESNAHQSLRGAAEPFKFYEHEEQQDREGAEPPPELAGVPDSLGNPTPISTAPPPVNGDSAPWTVGDDPPDTDGGAPTERADIDARGSWIPPALRGIAPDAQEAGQNLPRRR